MNSVLLSRPTIGFAARFLAVCGASLVLFCGTAAAQSTFSSERLLEAARAHLQQLASTTEVEPTGSIADQTFSQSGVQARIRNNTLAAGSTQNVVVEFTYNDKVIRQLSIPFRVARTVAVPVAAVSLPAGTVLSHQHIAIEQRPAASVRTRTLVAVDSLVGKKLTSNVAVSESLTTDKLTQADAIRRGQNVTLLARSGSIVVSTQARALGDALPGEQVTVVRNGASASIRATALGNGVVEITAP